MIDMFAEAPVPNPDGTTGIKLNILVDEQIEHKPNCDTDLAAKRNRYFGTENQRRMAPAVREAKELAVRYAWSGHSSRPGGGRCMP